MLTILVVNDIFVFQAYFPNQTIFDFPCPLFIITLETKLTIAVAGCSGSSSAKIWHWLSVLLAGFLATKPKHRLKKTEFFITKITWPSLFNVYRGFIIQVEYCKALLDIKQVKIVVIFPKPFFIFTEPDIVYKLHSNFHHNCFILNFYSIHVTTTMSLGSWVIGPR